MKERMMLVPLVLALCCAGCVGTAGSKSEVASSAAGAAGGAHAAGAPRPVRVSPDNTEAAEPAAAAAPDGSVYVTWVEHRPAKEADVWLARLDGEGKAAGPPARVNPEAGRATAWHGNPPAVGVAPDGATGHNSTLYLSASRDGGKSFGAPVKVNDDAKPAVHGMHAMTVAPDGRVHMAWLDERNVAPPPHTPQGSGHKHKESNREVFFASSADGGRTFSANRRVAAEVCPCCKISLAAGADGRVYVSWRQVLPGEFRHIAVASSADGGSTFSEPVIVSDDRWMIPGCPVSGSAMAVGKDGALRVLWYTAGEAGPPGLYWSESRDGGRTFAARRPFAESGGRGTPTLLPGGDGRLIAVWESSEPARPVAARLSEAERPVGGTALSGAGELPAAASSSTQVFVAYVSKQGGGSSVWLAAGDSKSIGIVD